jgi:hypothetical protein
MTNDAKLGMLVGVLGVIVAAVLFTNASPPAQSQPSAAELPAQQKAVAPTVVTVAPPPEVKSEKEPLPSTPVVRTRKEADAQPTSRPSGMEEEP